LGHALGSQAAKATGSLGDPQTTAGPCEAAWEAVVERCLEGNCELAEATAALSDEALAAPLAPGRAAPWQLVQGIIAHNAYHTCEVISIRHMLGLWLERT